MRCLVNTRRTISAKDAAASALHLSHGERSTREARADIASMGILPSLVRGRKPFQHFQTPPEKVAGDQNAERHFHQLDDQLVLAHKAHPPHARAARSYQFCLT